MPLDLFRLNEFVLGRVEFEDEAVALEHLGLLQRHLELQDAIHLAAVSPRDLELGEGVLPTGDVQSARHTPGE